MGATYEGELELDAAESPKHFTLTFTKGPEKGNVNPGIYELDGDTWRICIATRGGGRPKRFATKAGSGHALETLVRKAPEQYFWVHRRWKHQPQPARRKKAAA